MRSLEKLSVVVALLLITGCAGQEEQVVDMFFSAIQGGDDAALGRISLATFPGDVTSWELVEIGPESESPFALPGLHEELAEKRSELRLETARNSNFAGDYRSLFAEYKKKHAEDPDQKFTGDLGEFQTEWEERMKRQGALEKEVEALNEKAQALRSAAGLSLNAQVNENFVGDVKEKEVQLKVNDGSAEKSYTFKLLRYDLVDQERNMNPIARWIIADIKEQV